MVGTDGMDTAHMYVGIVVINWRHGIYCMGWFYFVITTAADGLAPPFFNDVIWTTDVIGNHRQVEKLRKNVSFLRLHCSCWWCQGFHYSKVIMNAMASQITGASMVCSTVCSGADQREHQSSASLAFVRGIHRCPVNSPHKRPVTRKMFPFDDVTIPHKHSDVSMSLVRSRSM